MNKKEMIAYFESVKAQHQIKGYQNSNSEVIVRTYDFVIKKLEEHLQ